MKKYSDLFEAALHKERKFTKFVDWIGRLRVKSAQQECRKLSTEIAMLKEDLANCKRDQEMGDEMLKSTLSKVVNDEMLSPSARIAKLKEWFDV